jgi:hypothetical protein
MDSLDGYVSDDELAIAPLAELGWDVETVSWRDPNANWDCFEAVIVRTTWDYQKYPSEFIAALRAIDRSAARLENSLSVIEWNLDKRYLRALEAAGAYVVPTVWAEKAPDARVFNTWQESLRSRELVIKPTVSATAADTFRLDRFDPLLSKVFATRAFMVQPFLEAIVSEGEYSLFFFCGGYSHAIVKAPKPGDFRVQEEHGGIIEPAAPSDELLRTARTIMNLIAPVPLYGRVDLVRDAEGRFMLMELELIEPSLYLRMDPRSPRMFAAKFHERMNEL